MFETKLVGFAVFVAMTVAPEGSRLRRLLLRLLAENPGLRSMVAGLGQSIDPLPACYRSTFITEDQLAIAEDWLIVGRDMRVGLWKAEDHVRGDRRQPAAKRQE